MAVMRLVVAFCMTIVPVLTPVFAQLKAGGEEAFFENWGGNKEFTADYAVELKKNPDKDFVILNFTDTQLDDYETFGSEGKITEETIKRAIETAKPDLITVTGDNGLGSWAWLRLIRVIESYKIPWAPVMGNHDGAGCISEFWCAYQFANAEHCLFKFGPKDMGYGNYMINITENGKIIHTLFMIDTHSKEHYQIENESGEIVTETGYDHMWANQIAWYKWGVEGVKKLAGETVESTMIMHIPIYEYKTAWELCGERNSEMYKKMDGIGENRENVCCPMVNNGVFDVILEEGSTKTVLAGHDHINDTMLTYSGIRLCYGLKCGPGCYWNENVNGGTTITINSNGNASVNHIYINSQDFDTKVTFNDLISDIKNK